MIIESIDLRDFRNYGEAQITLSPGINIFLGSNAQGKTNIIEAVSYASLARSHRTHADSELIRWGAAAGRVVLRFSRMDVKSTLVFEFPQGGRRRILLNDHPIRSKELIGSVQTVLFSPEDLYLVKGSPGARRAFLDRELSQASPAYYQQLLDYTRILRQRGVLLKKIRERKARPDALDVWDAQLVPLAAAITEKRMAATKKLSMLANLMQRKITENEENLALTYECHGRGAGVTSDLRSWYNETLDKNREKDILRASTSVGPHLDDLLFAVNGIDLKKFGSQGQQRTGALSVKLAELEFLHAETGGYPILLLDDVMSELDIRRRLALLTFLRRERIQTIITATDEAYFPDASMGDFYHVRAGKITR